MYKVYWTDYNTGEALDYLTGDMVVALNKTSILRQEGHRFIVMASENADQVGQMGVDAVVDGKLPSGEDYTWKKRRI